jgi:DNA processing protein
MDVHDYLSEDGQVVLALCSAFGLPEAGAANRSEPFKLAEWNQLARQIHASAFKRPAQLCGKDAAELAKALTISAGQAERIVALLERSGGLSHDLEAAFARGLWAVTRVDERYPKRLRNTLKHQAPTVLFGAGEVDLLHRSGVAVVGSRNIDEPGAAFARQVGRKAVAAGLVVVSGGARGTDRIAMDGALEADGAAVGVLADSLEATIRKADVRQFVSDGRLVLVTPYAPSAGFTIGGAMGRNKVIYALADFAVIVSSDFQTGGTWAGAVDALKGSWSPTFVREGDAVGKGNRELIKLGGVALTDAELETIDDLADWMREHAPRRGVEPELFDL